MKRIGLLAAALLAMCAFSGVAASSSMAACQQVFEPGTGTFKDPACSEPLAGGEWIWINRHVTYLGNNVWCAETTKPGEGNYTDGTCQKKVANSNFALVIQPTYPGWKIQGKRLGPQEKRQMKISAGTTSLSGKIVGENSKISCQKAVVENAYIEGSGTGAGQDGSTGITFSGCTNVGPINCTVNEPIKTTQLKSHLVTYGEGQGKVGDLFEPSQGTEYVAISFHGEKCPKGIVEPATFPVKGSVAAELKPKTQKQEQEPLEAVVGEIFFPEQSISKVKLEGQAVEPKLTIGGPTNPATFTGKFESQLVSQSGVGIPFGVSR